MEKLRAAVVGCGARGRGHIRILKSFEDIDLVAVCDPVDEIRERRRGEFEVDKGYANLADLLSKEKLDAIVVATPPHLNAPVAMECLEAGHQYPLGKTSRTQR